MPEVNLRIPDPISLLKLRIDANCEIAREFFETAEVLEKLSASSLESRRYNFPDGVAFQQDEFTRAIRALKDSAWEAAINCVVNTLHLNEADAPDAISALDRLRNIIKDIGPK